MFLPTSQALLPFVKKSVLFLLTLHSFCGCSSHTSNLPLLWLVSAASFVFKNFHDRQRDSSI